MFEDNNNNAAPAPPFLNSPFQYPTNVSNQLQLCENLPAEFHSNPVNYLANNNSTPFLLPNKRSRDIESVPRQQLLPLNNETFNNGANSRKSSIFSQNPVFTGLRLACDDDRPDSFLTSTVLSSEIRRELNQHNDEFNRFIRSQEENMVKGLRDIRRRHTISLLSTLERSILRKLQEKEVQLETATRKNKELMDTMRRATNEVQNWHYVAKYNESVVNVLKTNLQQAMQNSGQGQEGFGECDAEDAVSCVDPNNYLSSAAAADGAGRSNPGNKSMICRCCQSRKAAVLLMPCRHLCVCVECESFVSICPVCKMIKSSSYDVYLS
ncbi:BOI-related E3 ubiquitin-protein ligase 1-like isoform X2 [Andrographis paniculata]|nr:BOI-related E3 ubiquitin-protein ligase 1-like isoform X2 [Andrographis paniculata]XP_051122692.1 BOI-related E3 ubiquitin-protein ligase 1-like isoform X2 [Andrographis paniculata]